MPSDHAALVQGAAALGCALTDDQAARLLDYLALLAKWNRVYNLTAIREPSAMLAQHLLDSIAVVPPLRRWSGGRPLRVLDVGSGAGLPGVVIATLMPENDVTCVDAVGKKTAFIRQAAGQLGLTNLHAVHSRIESFAGPAFDVVTSRAFAALADFVTLTRGHCAPGSIWLAMKGKHPHDEIAGLSRQIEVFHVEQLRVPGLDAERCLVWMRERA